MVLILEKYRNFEGEGKTLNSEARFFLPLRPYPFPAPFKGVPLKIPFLCVKTVIAGLDPAIF